MKQEQTHVNEYCIYVICERIALKRCQVGTKVIS